MRQLIDLNQDAVNFHLRFQAASENGKEFQAVVVSQKTLNQEGVLDYQEAPGILSGEIETSQNVYDNYFLVLKSSEPIAILVEVELTPYPEYITPSTISESTPNENETSRGGGDSSEMILGMTPRVLAFCAAALLVAGIMYIIRENRGKMFGNGGTSSGSGTRSGGPSLLEKLKQLPLEN